VVVETSLLCNRQYDLGSLPKVMEEVSGTARGMGLGWVDGWIKNNQ
jgi:hypothetical protein